MDLSLYNSFGYLSPPGFGRGGVTPTWSIARSHYVSSSMLLPVELFSPNVQPSQGPLWEQAKEIFYLGAECQALSTQLAKQFQTLSGLKVMHHMAAQATAHETINAGHLGQDAAYSILMNGDETDKKCDETLLKLARRLTRLWRTPTMLYTITNCSIMPSSWVSSPPLIGPFRKSGMRFGNVSKDSWTW